MDPEALATLRTTFLDEGSEQLDRFQQALLRLEGDPEARSELDAAFRMLHNLKGSAAGVSFPTLAAFAHEVEELLGRLRRLDRVPRVELDRLFEAADAMVLHLDEAARDPGAREPAGPGRERMDAWRRDEGLAPRPPDLAVRARDAGARVVRVRFQDGVPMLGMRALLAVRALHGLGEVVGCDPPEDGLDALAAPGRDPVLRVALRSEEGLALEQVLKALRFPEVAEVALEVDTPAPAPLPEPKPTLRTEASRVRVRIERIDDLLHLAAELRQSREDLRGHIASAQELLPRGLRHELDEVLGRQDRLLRRLTDDILATRMVPVGALFRRFPRMVRDLCRKLGREVTLTTEGEGTELDAKLVDRVADPVVHLLRNAIDHGIEPPDERAAAGKPRAGRVHLRALAEGQTVRVEVEDDGRGIDLARIREKALARGVASEREVARMGYDELIGLVFRPGFSTRDEVSAVSGRGVGLDVVREEVENLNGELAVEPLDGGGTRVSLRFPLTLALTEALIVRAGEEVFALPVGHVDEVVRQEDARVEVLPGRGRALTVRDRTLPLLPLRELVGHDPAPASEERFAVVVRGASQATALAVDQLLGEVEIVVRPMAPHFPPVPGVAGATLSKEGRVVLILDVHAALRRKAGATGGREERA